ncbi:MAG: DNA-binding protein [Rhodobacteraceae bacterium]|jgi:hypothetical protein|nr:DNA-binding protein [Paracoccaceae bacterium]
MPAARHAFVPRLLPAPAAAHYLGVSETTLRGLGIPRRRLEGKRVYDIADLDLYADSLPYEVEGRPSTCAGRFGRPR